MLAGLDAFNSTFLADLNSTEQRITAANQQITSGFRVNEASDDPAAVASIISYQSQIDQATQIQTNLSRAAAVASSADAALSSASISLDNLTSLATEGASTTTLQVSRTSLSTQVQAILQQLVGLANTSVQGEYIFGGDDPATPPYTLAPGVPGGVVQNNTASNTATIGNVAGVQIVATQTAQQIFGDGDTTLVGNSQRVDAAGATFVKGASPANDEKFNFSVYANGHTTAVTATVAASAAGQTLTNVLTSLNSQLSPYGIAALADNGLLKFSGSSAFTVNESAATGTQLLTSTAGTGATVNTSNYAIAGQSSYSPAAGDSLQFQTSAGPVTVALAAGTPLGTAITQINASTATLGVYAVENPAGTGISFQAQNSFSITNRNAGAFAAAGTQSAAAPTTSGIFQTVYALGQALQNDDQTGTQNAVTALKASALQLAQSTTYNGNTEKFIQNGQNSATSFITSFQTALGNLRDADVAQQATNLTLDNTALQAALAAHGSLDIKSLFSYLG